MPITSWQKLAKVYSYIDYRYLSCLTLEQTLSYSLLCSFVIKYFWVGSFVPPRMLHLGQLPSPSAPVCYKYASGAVFV